MPGGEKMNPFTKIVDGIVNAVAPQKALKRAGARARTQILNSGYGNYGASTTKKGLAGWIFGGGSAREDINDNLPVLRQRSRDLYMGVPIATGAIKTMRTNVVGRGLKLKPTIDRETLGISAAEAKNLEKQIEREWAVWAESPDCDMSRLDNFYELQQLAFTNWLMSGDCLAVLPVKPRVNQPYDLRINLIEADRLQSPNDFDTFDNKIVGGVEQSEDGEVIAYHFTKHHPLSYANEKMEWVRVEAYGSRTGRKNVLHIMCRERIGQRRGVPFLAPVIEALKQLGRYTDAELVAAVVSGMFTIFIEKDSTSSDDAIGSAIPEEMEIDEEDDTTIELAPGAVIDLNDGEKAHDMNPGRPNSNFGGFVEAICQQIGAALEIPYELLVKRFNSSYTASKGALEEAWKMFRMYRGWLAMDFCQPVYEEWLAEAVAKGRIKMPGFFKDPIRRKAYCKAEWNGPARGSLDPVREVTAAEKRIANGLSTRTAETMEITGGDYYSNIEQLKQEEKKMKEVKDIANGSNQSKQQPTATTGADNDPTNRTEQQTGADNDPANGTGQQSKSDSTE